MLLGAALLFLLAALCQLLSSCQATKCSELEYVDLRITLEVCWSDEAADGYIFQDALKQWGRKIGAILDYVHRQMIRKCETACDNDILMEVLTMNDVENKVLIEMSEKLAEIVNHDGTLETLVGKYKAFEFAQYHIGYHAQQGYSIHATFNLDETTPQYLVNLFFSKLTGINLTLKVLEEPKGEL